MASFPFSLPAPMVQGYGISPVDKNLRTDMESGAARVRRRTAARLDQVDVVWRFRADEVAAFRAWFESRGDYNLLRYSEDLAQTYWLKTRGSIASNVATAPGGAVTAEKFTEDTAAGTHHVSRGSIAFVAGTAYTASVYAKAAERTQVVVQIGNTGAVTPVASAAFDLSTGALLSATSSVADRSIVSAGDGWWRVSATAIATASATDQVFLPFLRNAAGAPSYTGDGVSGAFCWGAQLVIGRTPAPYIRTHATGADGLLHGADWFDISLPLGNLTSENRLARFVGAPQYRAVAGGLIWDVSAKLEVR